MALAQNYFQSHVAGIQKIILQYTVADYERFLRPTQNQCAMDVMQHLDILTTQAQFKQS